MVLKLVYALSSFVPKIPAAHLCNCVFIRLKNTSQRICCVNEINRNNSWKCLLCVYNSFLSIPRDKLLQGLTNRPKKKTKRRIYDMVKWTVSLIQIPIKGTLIKTNVVMVMVTVSKYFQCLPFLNSSQFYSKYICI